MSRILAVVALVFIAPSHAQDDWLGLNEPQYHLRGSWADFSDSGQILALQLQLPFVAFSQVQISAAQQIHEDADQPATDTWSLAWQSDDLQDVGFGFAIEQMTSAESYDQSSAQMQLSYQFNRHWLLAAQIGYGQIDFHLQSLDVSPQGLSQQNVTSDANRLSTGLSLSYVVDSWGLHIAARYDEINNLASAAIDTTGEQSMLPASERRILEAYYAYLVASFIERGFTEQEATNRSNLLFISFRDELRDKAAIWTERQTKVNARLSRHLSSQLNWQQSQLINYEMSIGLFKRFNRWQLHTGLQAYENFFNNELNTQFYVSVEYAFSQNLEMELSYGQIVDEGDEYLQLSVGLSW